MSDAGNNSDISPADDEQASARTAKARDITGLAALGASSANGAGGHPLLRAMGGVLGICEAVIPGIVFLVVFTAMGFPQGVPWPAIGWSVLVAAVFTIVRLVRRQPVTQAIAGLASIGASALLAVWSNRPQDNFVLGIWTNGAYAAVFLISILVGWPIVGVLIGLARQEGAKWRCNRHHRRVFTGVTFIWLGMFVVRVAIELPLFIAGNVAALAVTKLALGLPLYVPVLAVSWVIIRGLYHEKTPPVEEATAA